MLRQNFKGLLTLVLIFTLLVGGFYLYKTIVEPSLISNEVETFPVGENIEVSPSIQVESSQATLSWETPFSSVGAVMYCEKNNQDQCKEVNNNNKSTKQSFTLTNLIPETEYTYKILINNEYYPMDENSYYEFKTKPESANTMEPQVSPSVKKSTLQRTPPQKPLGTKTPMNLIEFREAQKTQNLEYDANKDGKIDINDYQP